jgi:hypothetical protein
MRQPSPVWATHRGFPIERTVFRPYGATSRILQFPSTAGVLGYDLPPLRGSCREESVLAANMAVRIARGRSPGSIHPLGLGWTYQLRFDDDLGRDNCSPVAADVEKRAANRYHITYKNIRRVDDCSNLVINRRRDRQGLCRYR